MKFGLKTAAFLLFIIYCHRKENNAELTTEPQKVKDTVQSEKPDGVAVEDPQLLQTDKMPPLLVKQLDTFYPGWQIPEFSQTLLVRLEAPKRNLIWIKGDFDKNKQEDYAVQVVFQDSISVIAFLQQTGKDTFTRKVLARESLIMDEKKSLKSFCYLTFLAKNDSVYDGHLNTYHKIPQDAIFVSQNNDAAVFYKTKSWIKIELPGPKTIID